MAKGLARGQGFDLNDDNGALAIVDSLNSRDPLARAFYFWLVSRSLHYSDGYYGEAISVTAYHLYDTLPCEFLGHFVRSECISPEEQSLWSSELGFEFFLNSDNIANGKFERVQKWVRDKCEPCSAQERLVAESILKTIKSDVQAEKDDQ